MNNEQTGKLIKRLRLEKGMTQKKLSELLNVTEQAVSKWERGLGLPEISILPRLSEYLEININNMLLGSLNENNVNGGNMKEIHFYVCLLCNNLISNYRESRHFMLRKGSEGIHQLQKQPGRKR